MTVTEQGAALQDSAPRRVNVAERFGAELTDALRASAAQASTSELFAPAWEIPPPSASWRTYAAAAEMSVANLGTYRGRQLRLLNLMHNPGTLTTKTFASLIIVARAVRHVQDTGEPVVILTPSSANKATALRDAVLRAYRSGLATPDQLRIVTVVPAEAAAKLWASELTADGALRRANPLVMARTERPGDVKVLAKDVAERESARLHRDHGVRVWHSMDLRNYAVADALRAFFEAATLPMASARVHAHSVSSAFGLLGHFFGHQVRTAETWPDIASKYLLVQHLGTPDMVSSLYHGHFDHRPNWSFDGGLYRQDDPHFPYTSYSPYENLDPTFYTHAPATSARMNSIIGRYGGGGIVTSLHECLQRYGHVRELLATASVSLPEDPRLLREWSLVMACTGVLNAIDRDIVAGDEVLIHGSGSYGVDDFATPPRQTIRHIDGATELADVVREVAGM